MEEEAAMDVVAVHLASLRKLSSGRSRMRRMRTLLCWLAALLSFLAAANSTSAQAANTLFGPAITYGSGGVSPLSVAVVDVNLDGKPDMVALNCGGSSCTAGTVGTLGVLLGNGDGTFGPAKVFSAGGYDESFSLKVADVNGDGKPDLIVANSCADSTCATGGVSVLLGNGDGTFQLPVTYAAGGYETVAVAVADVNGDGKLDLVTANFCYVKCTQDGAVGVLFGNGDGTFQSATTYVLTAAALDVAVGDLNGDGKPDIVVSRACASNCDTTGADVLLGNGNGTFLPPVTYTTGGYDFAAIAVADVNGDGKPDLVVGSGCADNTCVNGGVSVLLGNGDGTFGAPRTYSAGYTNGGFGGRSIAVRDLNGDGKPDVIVPSFCLDSSCKTGGGVTVLLGNGDGTVQPAVTYSSGGYGAFIGVAAADLNGDGKPDLAIANTCANSGSCTGGGALGVLLNTGSAVGADWTHTWGGGSADSIVANSRDANGNLYLAGSTSSFGAGGEDALVLKYDPSGKLLWAKTWGGPKDDAANAIAVGPDGFLYVTGSSFSFGSGCSFGACSSLFVLKLDPDGNLQWATNWNNPNTAYGNSLAFDSMGNIYVAGSTLLGSAIAMKLSPSDGSVLWASSFSVPSSAAGGFATATSASAVTVDSNGNLIVAGTWEYYDVDRAMWMPLMLLVKYDANGNYLWNAELAIPTYPGSSRSVVTDTPGNIYFVGGFTLLDCVSYNCAQTGSDAVALKFDSGGSLQWERSWGGTGFSSASSVAVDPAGHLRVSGIENERGQSPTPFVLTYDSNGNLLSSIGWQAQQPLSPGYPVSMVLDPAGDAYVAGAALNSSGAWVSISGNSSTLPFGSAAVPYSLAIPSGQVSNLSNPTVLQTGGIADTGGGGPDAFVSAIPANYTPPAEQPVASVAPSPLNFPNQTVNTTSGALAVTVTNNGNAPLGIASIPPPSGPNAADFSVASVTPTAPGGGEVNPGGGTSPSASNCSSIPPGLSCVIDVTFTPSTAGPESATLSIYDNAANSPQAVSLNGTGIAPAASPPTVSSTSQPQVIQGGSVSLFLINGANFQADATVSFSGGQDIAITGTSISSTQIVLNLSIAATAASGLHSVTVTNPDGQSAVFADALTVVTIPAEPQGLYAVDGNQAVYLSWGGTQSTPEGYNVYVNGVKANSSGLIQGNSFAVNNLQNGQTYKLSITALGGGGESDPATISARPNPYSAPGHPLHAILFLHGIHANATAWTTTTDFLAGTLGWTCGGTLAYAEADDPRSMFPHWALPSDYAPSACRGVANSSADYFTSDFGDNLANYANDPDSTGIFRQGDEVGGFIRLLQGRGPLSLVAWSMGGLAARSYMQVTDPIDAANQISDLITLGTPHWGVNENDPLVIDAAGLLGFGRSRGFFDMNGGCAANGDYGAPQYLSQFLQSLDYQPTFLLPKAVRYVVISGLGGPFFYNVDCNQPLEQIRTDGAVPETSSTLSNLLTSSTQLEQLDTDDVHTEPLPGTALPDDISSILCAIDNNCLEFNVMSPVTIQVTAPNGQAISNGFTSMPGANYTNVTDVSGHETATILIPFPQGGQYAITVTPKPGAQPTETFTILQTQDGVTTTIAENMQIANIPPSGFQATVKNGSTFAVNFGGSVQQPLINDGNGHFVATVTITNQGNVTVDSAQIVATTTTLSTASLSSPPAPITNLTPGAIATVTLTFPITSALSTATSAPLRINGTYSAGTLSGNWSVTFRSVTLGTSIVGEN